MWFFRKKKQTKQESPFLSDAKKEILEKAKERAELNGLSPVQTDKIIQNNKDVDFLTLEIQKEMDIPDTDYLSKRLLPELKNVSERKNISDDDIFNSVSVGDIIGAPFEFKYCSYARKSSIQTLTEHSRYTDDTVLAYAVLQAISENEKEPDFRKWYIAAFKKYPNAGYGGSFMMWARNQIDNSVGYHSIGNGCAMRVACIASHYDNIEEMIQHTIESVMPTHDNVESVKGAVILNVCIWMALHGCDKEEIYNYAKNFYHFSNEEKENLIYKNYQFDISSDFDSVTDEENEKSIYVNYAVPYAIKCFYDTNSYEECMHMILTKFCDADTICAIAGGLCFAYYGKSDLNIKEIALRYTKNLCFDK